MFLSPTARCWECPSRRLVRLSEKAVYTAIKRGELLVCYVHSSTAHIRRRDLDDWISCLPERPQ